MKTEVYRLYSSVVECLIVDQMVTGSIPVGAAIKNQYNIMSTMKFYCNYKNEDMNGISLHFSMGDNANVGGASTGTGQNGMNGNIAIHRVPKAVADEFQPGVEYELSFKALPAAAPKA